VVQLSFYLSRFLFPKTPLGAHTQVQAFTSDDDLEDLEGKAPFAVRAPLRLEGHQGGQLRQIVFPSFQDEGEVRRRHCLFPDFRADPEGEAEQERSACRPESREQDQES